MKKSYVLALICAAIFALGFMSLLEPTEKVSQQASEEILAPTLTDAIIALDESTPVVIEPPPAAEEVIAAYAILRGSVQRPSVTFASSERTIFQETSEAWTMEQTPTSVRWSKRKLYLPT